MAAASAMAATMTTLPAGSQTPGRAPGAPMLDQNDFLLLLTTQLKKQNPLNPSNPSDLAAELAQFSTASGVQALNASLSAATGFQAASLVGRSVAVPGNTLVLGRSGGAKGALSLPAPAREVTVTIADSAGNRVAAKTLGPLAAGNRNFEWDGKGAGGSALPPGNYSFSVKAVAADGATIAATAYAVAPVLAVSLGGPGGPVLDLGGGLGPVGFGQIHQVF